MGDHWTPGMSHLLIGILLSAVVGFLVWAALCVWVAGACVEAALSDELPCQHRLILNNLYLDRISCMDCQFDMELPRGAPESLSQRVEWARQHGLLRGSGGVSVAFLEALRGTS